MTFMCLICLLMALCVHATNLEWFFSFLSSPCVFILFVFSVSKYFLLFFIEAVFIRCKDNKIFQKLSSVLSGLLPVNNFIKT